MSEPRGLRDLNRLRWVTIVLPIVFVWGFELVRFTVLDPNLTSDESHVAAAMVLGGAIVLFAMLVSVYLDRAQRQLVSPEQGPHGDPRGQLRGPWRPLAAGPPGAVAWTASSPRPGPWPASSPSRGPTTGPSTIRRPATLPPGLAWLGPVLDEAMDPAVDAPRYTQPVRDRHGRPGPPADPRHPAHRPHPPRLPPARRARHQRRGLRRHRGRDRRRRPAGHDGREPPPPRAGARGPPRRRPPAHRPRRAARRPGHDHPARPRAPGRRARRRLPGDPRATGPRIGIGAGGERLAMADDGSMCRVAHEKTAANHPQNPPCPLIARRARTTAWIARPLRGPDGRARRAVRRPPRPSLHATENGPPGRARRHGRHRRPHRPPPRGRGAVDDPRRARPDRPRAARQPGPGPGRDPPPAALRSRRAPRTRPASGIADELVRAGRDRRRGLQRRPRGDPGPPRDRPRGRRPGGLAARVPAQVQPPDRHRGDAAPARATPAARSAREPRSSSCASSRRRSPTPASTRAPPRVTVRIDCARRRHDPHDRGRWGRLRPPPWSARWRAASASPPCGSGWSRSAARSTCILRRPRGRESSSGSTQRTRVGTHATEAPGAARR